MHYDPRDYGQEPDDEPGWLSRFACALLLVLGAIGLALLAAGLFWLALRVATAAEPAPLLVVDGAGRVLLECDSPAVGQSLPLYVFPPSRAAVCVNPRPPVRIFRDGFES